MPALSGGVSPEKYFKESLTQLKDAFRPWRDKAQTMRRLILTERRDVPKQSAYTGNWKSDAAVMRQQMSQYVSGRLALIHRSAIGSVINGKVLIHTAMIAEDRDQREQQSRLENIASFPLIEQDRKAARYGKGTSWQRRAAFHAFVDGKIVGRLQVIPSPYDANQLSVDWPLYDPLTCYHDFDSWPRRFIHDFSLGIQDARHILQGLGLPLPKAKDVDWEKRDGQVSLQECWLEERLPDGTYKVQMAMLAEEVLAGDPVERFGAYAGEPFTRMPIIVSCAYAEPGSTLKDSEARSPEDLRGLSASDLLYHAQSFYSPLEHIHGTFNEFMSLGMEGLAWGLNKMRKAKSLGGTFVPPPAEQGPGGTVVLDTAKQEDLEVDNASLVGIPEAMTAFVNLIDEEADRLYNSAMMGKRESGESGFSYNSRIFHGLTVMLEPLACIANFYLQGIEEFLHQWRKNDSYKMRFEGVAESGNNAGHFAIEEYDIEDLPKAGSYALEVEVAPKVPIDDMVQLNYVLQATQDRPGVGPVLDLEQALKSLGYEDPKAIMDRIAEQRVFNSPQMQAGRLLKTLWAEYQTAKDEAGRGPESKVKQTAARLAQLFYEAAELQLLGQAQTAVQQARKPVGARPEAMPSEAGVQNPDFQALAAGTQSSSTQGRPPVASGNGSKPGGTTGG